MCSFGDPGSKICGRGRSCSDERLELALADILVEGGAENHGLEGAQLVTANEAEAAILVVLQGQKLFGFQKAQGPPVEGWCAWALCRCAYTVMAALCGCHDAVTELVHELF